MNLSTFTECLKAVHAMFNIGSDEYIISSGGAMLVLGLREKTRDIDISVNERVWESLKQEGFEVIDYGAEHPKVIRTVITGPRLESIEVEFYADFKKVKMPSLEVRVGVSAPPGFTGYYLVRILQPEGVLIEKLRRYPKTEKDRLDIQKLVYWISNEVEETNKGK